MKTNREADPNGARSRTYTRRALLGGVAGGAVAVPLLKHGGDSSALGLFQSTGTTFVRRDLHSLAASGAELQAFARGVAAMKQRPASDPTSWAFQASLHPSNCQHSTIHFVSWHRMYLYFFERILRQASGDPTFTLPFWNYSVQTQRILPAPFRDPANALYVAQRSYAVRSGQQPGSDQNYRFDFSTAFAATNFTHTGNGTSFAGRVGARGLLEGSPHNTIHTWIGGYMGTLEQAALDPIFWTHHANLDRLWEGWLRRGGGRANPTSGVFLDTNFTFYDVGGNAVVMRGSQILNTVGQLNYRYDDQGALGSQSLGRRGQARPVKYKDVGASTGRPLRLGNRPVTVPVAVRGEASRGRRGRRRSGRAQTSLTLVGVAGGGVPDVGYEVHVNATTAHPSPHARSFVGPLGLFGLQPSDHPGHAPHTADVSFVITKALAGSRTGQPVEVTLVPANLTDSGVLPGGTWATIERLVVSLAVPTGNGKKKPKKRRAKPGNKQRTRQRAAEPKQRRPSPNKRRRTSTPKRKRAGADKRLQSTDGGTAAQVPGNKLSTFEVDLTSGEPVGSGHAHH